MFAPGEADEFGWGHGVVLIDGLTVAVKVAHVRLVPQPDVLLAGLPLLP